MTKTIPPPPPIQRRHLQQTNLSFSQESLWFLQQLDPENIAYNSTYLIKFTGGIDPSSLEKAFRELIRRHEPLRTLYPNKAGRPVQVIQPFESIVLPLVDLSGLREAEQEQAIQRYASEQGNQPFNLQRGPLIRFALLRTTPKEDFLFFAIHHIGFDAWSRHVLIGDLLRLYDAYRSGDEPRLPELPVQYADYALWQREWLSGETLEIYLEHWKNILFGELPTIDLPTDHPRPAMQTYHGARHYFQIAPTVSAHIKDFCQEEHITPFRFFLAAYAVLLTRYTGQEDLIIGCPFANRPLPELDGIIGAFINTLPIRLDLSGNPNVHTLLGQVQRVIQDAFDWQAVPFETLVSELSPKRDLSRTPIFQVLINMRNVPRRLNSIDGLKVKNIVRDDANAAFDISLEFEGEEDHFNVAVRYNVDLFDQATILHMVAHYQNIIHAMLDRPERPISEIEMLTASEQQRLLQDWNKTQADVPQQSIHEMIFAQAAKNPDALAVVCNGRQLTYSDLERKANQLAAYLLVKGVKPGKLAGIFLPRSEDLLITQLAILKAGGAYVPFDLMYPIERLSYILKDTEPVLIVTDSFLGPQIPNRFQKIYLDSDVGKIQAYPEQANFTGTDPDSLLYATYTSGSTGRPKGAINIQRGAVNYLHHLIKTFQLKAGERVIQFTPLSFDAAFRDTLGVLTFGGTVVLMDDEQMRNPDFINTSILEQQVTCILSVVPTMLRAVARSMINSPTRENQLRLVMPSGEALQVADIKLVKEAYGKAVQIVNQYGPTECSMISTLYKVPEQLPVDFQSVPIGKPISNVRVYVLDQAHHPVPAGVRGELYIGGIGVGLGYLNQQALTAERFFPDPFWPGGRMYRSGDLVRYSPDGTLSYIGRLDHQVKIRGYRVELGEIEAIIGEFPNIQATAVVLWQRGDSEFLSAYITLSEKDQELSSENLQKYLKDRLPFYMLPSTITILKEMPLTPNRKIDRRSLPFPEIRNGQERYLAPRNNVEKRLVSIWKEVLDVNQVGVRDNFFELGGHSLLAVRLFTRIQEDFGQSLPLMLLFQNGTVEALAKSLSSEEKNGYPQGIVPIQPNGSQIPLFIVSAGLYMRQLAFAMAPNRPVYGLDSSEGGKVTYRKSVQETARIYYKNLVAFYPQGPYLLLGHSAHGYFALEVARLLIANGKDVAFLGLLDAYPPGPRRQANLVDRIKIHLYNLQEKNLPEILQYFKRSIQRLLTRWWKRAALDEKSIERYEKKGQAKEVRKLLLLTYKPEPYEGKVTFFSVTQRPWYMHWDPMVQWANILTGQVDTIPITGDHMTVLKPPQVSQLAEVIEALLPRHENA